MDANARFQAVSSGFPDVLRIKVGGQVAGGHDLIRELVIKIGNVQNRTVVRHPLLDARIVADAFLGLQRGIIRKRELESIRLAEAGSETGVQARGAEKAVAICLPRHIRGGNPRWPLSLFTGTGSV